MSPQELTEILRNYRPAKARRAYLQSQLEMLERFLRICEGEMVEDMSSMSQAITGMPHGTSAGDPCGRLATDIASGKISPFVKQIQIEIMEVQGEINKTARTIQITEIVLGAVGEKQRRMIEMKIIDELSWEEILSRMNREYHSGYSKRTLQRMIKEAMDKAREVVK